LNHTDTRLSLYDNSSSNNPLEENISHLFEIPWKTDRGKPATIYDVKSWTYATDKNNEPHVVTEGLIEAIKNSYDGSLQLGSFEYSLSKSCKYLRRRRLSS
jgi:hypothetical protein